MLRRRPASGMTQDEPQSSRLTDAEDREIGRAGSASGVGLYGLDSSSSVATCNIVYRSRRHRPASRSISTAGWPTDHDDLVSGYRSRRMASTIRMAFHQVSSSTSDRGRRGRTREHQRSTAVRRDRRSCKAMVTRSRRPAQGRGARLRRRRQYLLERTAGDNSIYNRLVSRSGQQRGVSTDPPDGVRRRPPRIDGSGHLRMRWSWAASGARTLPTSIWRIADPKEKIRGRTRPDRRSRSTAPRARRPPRLRGSGPPSTAPRT